MIEDLKLHSGEKCDLRIGVLSLNTDCKKFKACQMTNGIEVLLILEVKTASSEACDIAKDVLRQKVSLHLIVAL